MGKVSDREHRRPPEGSQKFCSVPQRSTREKRSRVSGRGHRPAPGPEMPSLLRLLTRHGGPISIRWTRRASGGNLSVPAQGCAPSGAATPNRHPSCPVSVGYIMRQSRALGAPQPQGSSPGCLKVQGPAAGKDGLICSLGPWDLKQGNCCPMLTIIR